jgi:hypothetical protein
MQCLISFVLHIVTLMGDVRWESKFDISCSFVSYITELRGIQHSSSNRSLQTGTCHRRNDITIEWSATARKKIKWIPSMKKAKISLKFRAQSQLRLPFVTIICGQPAWKPTFSASTRISVNLLPLKLRNCQTCKYGKGKIFHRRSMIY